MGISGLLPVLKPIQKQKHLSEFAGQTLAVDAYVWLHRGAYACAVELATHKPTKKYVDYCMHRVRLLRHYNIQPYIVFDGGPLPAKQGTEKEREKRREENLAKADALAKQGKQSQARDYYVKCVDVTPQMAYQVIKALKVENVPYVVAPYEADAQMAYLERIGFVDGIVTEDSDLLVFGCKNVLFKLDPVSASIIHISRADFGSPALASRSLSFIGWSDAQFRWMAMMSGCDYLPSIPGIGLKTAHTLLSKHKSVVKALRAIRLEGKKTIPNGYLEAFELAEKVFLHQRVYDPSQGKLVYLTDPGDTIALTDVAESYVGRDLEPALAKRVAEGSACPISLEVMEDINPNFEPKAIGVKPLQRRDLNTPVCDKTKTKAMPTPTPTKGGILNFFTPAAKSSSTAMGPKPALVPKSEPKAVIAGKGSGKRTLIEVMEEDIMLKRKRAAAQAERSSRFFGQHPQQSPGAGPSAKEVKQKSHDELGKENEPIILDSDDEGVIQEDAVIDPVEQEDGYLSPSPFYSGNVTPELSSPVQPRSKSHAIRTVNDESQSFDILSSPVHTNILFPPRRFALQTQNIPTQELEGTLEGDPGGRILVRGSSEPPQEEREERKVILGPDLRKNFKGDDEDNQSACSEISAWEEDIDQESVEFAASPSVSVTPPEQTQVAREESYSYEDILLVEDELEEVKKATCEKVALGWRQRFSYANLSTPSLMQSTPKRKFPEARSFSVSTSQKRRISPQGAPRSSFKSRKSDPFPLTQTKNGSGRRTLPQLQTSLPSDDIIEEIVHDGREKLHSFRFSR